MKKNVLKKVAVVLGAATLLFSGVLASCGGNATVEKSGVIVTNAVEGVEETKYVMCVSKASPTAETLLETINEVIDEVDIDAVAKNYCDHKNRRANRMLEDYMYNLNDNTGDPITVYTSTFEPFNYSGAGGAYTDGIDAYLMLHVAEKLDRQLKSFDLDYSYAYAQTKAGNADIFVAGVAEAESLKSDFYVSNVYLTGKQQIVSDKNQNFTKIEQLKGLTICVVAGREGEALVKTAIESGKLKGTGATILTVTTDTEAESMLHTEMCDVIVIDEFPAQLIVSKAS